MNIKIHISLDERDIQHVLVAKKSYRNATFSLRFIGKTSYIYWFSSEIDQELSFVEKDPAL